MISDEKITDIALAIKAIAGVLKKRFQNLSTEETLDLAANILQVLHEVKQK